MSEEYIWYTAPAVVNYSRLAVGIAMIVAPIITIRKISQGSKSTFAYILVLFCMYQGVQDVIRYVFSSLRREIYDAEGNAVYTQNFRSFVILNAVYQYLAVQTWIFALKYLESSIKMSVEKPICSLKCIQVVMWIGIVLITITTFGSMIYSLVTFPGQVNNGTYVAFDDYLANEYALAGIISTYPWLTMHVSSTFIQGWAIYKITKTTKSLNKCEVNNHTMLLHISMLIVQNLVMVICMAFGDVTLEIDSQGYEVALYGKFDTPLTFVDAGIELIICYICYTMGSSAQLRKFDCNIRKNKFGGYEVKFKPRERAPSITDDDDIPEYFSDQCPSEMQSDFGGEPNELNRSLRKRHQSVVQEEFGACDDIVQQFIRGLEDKLSKSFH